MTLIHLLEDEFNEVKVIGTRDGEEVDCLEHIAFFYEDRLLACSDSWDEKIHEVDKNLLYYQYLMHRHSPKMENMDEKSLQDRDSWLEVPVYLTHTGIINEVGQAMKNSIGSFAYRFICIPITMKCTLALLCSESIQVEEVMAYLKFQQ